MASHQFNNTFGSYGQFQANYYRRHAETIFRPAAPITDRHWSKILGISPTATMVEIKQAYRKLAKTTHSDVGGNNDAMSRLNIARDQALKERNGS